MQVGTASACNGWLSVVGPGHMIHQPSLLVVVWHNATAQLGFSEVDTNVSNNSSWQSCMLHSLLKMRVATHHRDMVYNISLL